MMPNVTRNTAGDDAKCFYRTLVVKMPIVIKNTGGGDAKRYQEPLLCDDAKRYQKNPLEQ
jgi:hypothetical protein